MYRPKTKNDFEFDELTSCMQKAIRRSEDQLAFNCARELLVNTPHYVWRRLITICMEDVYSTDFSILPYVRHCGESYFALSSVGFRAIDCLTAAVQSMCGFPKSRLSCDFQEALIDELENTGYVFSYDDISGEIQLPIGANNHPPSNSNSATFAEWISPIDLKLYGSPKVKTNAETQPKLFGSVVLNDIRTAHGKSINALYGLFIDAVLRQDKDNAFKAIFEISISQPYTAWLILLQQTFSHLNGSTSENRVKAMYIRNLREAYFHIRMRKEGTESVLALSCAVLCLCSAPPALPNLPLITEEWIDALDKANYRFTIPDWAHDRHTRKGRAKGRVDWTHFIKEGIKIIPETPLGDDEKYKLSVNEKSLDGSIKFAEIDKLTLNQIGDEIEILKQWSN